MDDSKTLVELAERGGVDGVILTILIVGSVLVLRVGVIPLVSMVLKLVQAMAATSTQIANTARSCEDASANAKAAAEASSRTAADLERTADRMSQETSRLSTICRGALKP